jgi:hypothetical protein
MNLSLIRKKIFLINVIIVTPTPPSPIKGEGYSGMGKDCFKHIVVVGATLVVALTLCPCGIPTKATTIYQC